MPRSNVILAGDSWAEFPCHMRSFERAFLSHRKPRLIACTPTVKSGSTAKEWAEKKNLFKFKWYLRFSRPEVVILMLGGNDLIDHWHTSLNLAEESLIFDIVERDLRKVLENALSAKKDLQIVIPSYDYPNFDVLHKHHYLINNQKGMTSRYTELYESLGSPSVGVLNRALIRFSMRVAQIASDYERVHYVNVMGVSQYTFGNENISLPYGNPDLPTPVDALFKVSPLNYVDPYHLGIKGFYNYAKFIVAEIIDRGLLE